MDPKDPRQEGPATPPDPSVQDQTQQPQTGDGAAPDAQTDPPAETGPTVMLTVDDVKVTAEVKARVRLSTDENPLAPPGATAADHDNLPASTTGGPRPRRPIEDEVEVDVHTAFNLTDDDGRVHRYPKGLDQLMPRSHADHWYAKLHISFD